MGEYQVVAPGAAPPAPAPAQHRIREGLLTTEVLMTSSRKGQYPPGMKLHPLIVMMRALTRLQIWATASNLGTETDETTYTSFLLSRISEGRMKRKLVRFLETDPSTPDMSLVPVTGFTKKPTRTGWDIHPLPNHVGALGRLL